jgi:hypothetical protein
MEVAAATTVRPIKSGDKPSAAPQEQRQTTGHLET